MKFTCNVHSNHLCGTSEIKVISYMDGNLKSLNQNDGFSIAQNQIFTILIQCHFSL